METTHPKDVNILKNIVFELEKRGHEVLMAARDKEGVFEKLDGFGIKYVPGTNYKGFFNKVIHIPAVELWLYRMARKFKPDVLFGPSSLYAAHVSRLIRKPYLCFSDCEAEFDYTRYLTVPFVTRIYVPRGFKLDLGERMERFNGYLELAYLHPRYFKPDIRVLDELGVDKKDQFVVLRISSITGFHDIGAGGSPLDDIKAVEWLIKEIENHCKVFISGGGSIVERFPDKKLEINPNRFLDLLAFSQLYIGDGISMAAEAGLLGVPSIYLSHESRRWGFIQDLAGNGLVKLCSSVKASGEEATRVLGDSKLRGEWRRRSQVLMGECEDMVGFFLERILSFCDSGS